MTTAKDYVELYNAIMDGEVRLAKMIDIISDHTEQQSIAFAEWCDPEGFQQFKVGGTWKNVRDSHIPESQEVSTVGLYQRFINQ